MRTEWANPIWHHVGLLGIVGFIVLIALVLVGRFWIRSRDEKRAMRGVELLGNIGGSRAGREARTFASKR
jgi:hypothetical protein